jgi:hypothetical protein
MDGSGDNPLPLLHLGENQGKSQTAKKGNIK